MKHTPGPWEYNKNELTIWQKDTSDDGNMDVAEIANNVDTENGLLIAAAPELLEACKEALMGLEKAFRDYADKKEAETTLTGSGNSNEFMPKEWHILKQAIAKVEG